MIISRSFRATRLSSIALALALIAGCAPATPPAALPNSRTETTVYLVRHAEKAAVEGGNSDVDLSTAGYARADSLAAQLRDADIDVVITTQLRRTRLTAGPIAALRRITPITVSVGSSVQAHAESVAVAVKRHPGSRILIVGHSNTVGPIIAALGGTGVGDLCDNEYSNLFILTLAPPAPSRLHTGSFGARDAPGNGACVPVRSR